MSNIYGVSMISIKIQSFPGSFHKSDNTSKFYTNLMMDLPWTLPSLRLHKASAACSGVTWCSGGDLIWKGQILCSCSNDSQIEMTSGYHSFYFKSFKKYSQIQYVTVLNRWTLKINLNAAWLNCSKIGGFWRCLWNQQLPCLIFFSHFWSFFHTCTYVVF